MVESKKTTTLSFRIEDELKEKLSQLAERENKTLTNKARELLAQSLNISPRKTLTENVLDDVRLIDRELRLNLTKWNMEISQQLSTVSTGKTLLNDYANQVQHLGLALEEEKARNHKTQRSLVKWAAAFLLATLASNAIVITLLVYLR